MRCRSPTFTLYFFDPLVLYSVTQYVPIRTMLHPIYLHQYQFFPKTFFLARRRLCTTFLPGRQTHGREPPALPVLRFEVLERNMTHTKRALRRRTGFSLELSLLVPCINTRVTSTIVHSSVSRWPPRQDVYGVTGCQYQYKVEGLMIPTFPLPEVGAN